MLEAIQHNVDHRDVIPYDSVQQDIEAFTDEIEAKGFHVRPSQNPKTHLEFAGEIGRIQNYNPITTIFDPDYNDLDAKNFLWLEVRSPTGTPVASVAARMIQGDVLKLIRTGRLWGEKQPVPVPSTKYLYPEDAPRMTGRSIYEGGLYIHPDFRYQNLATPLSKLHIAISTRIFRPDWHFCLQFRETRRRAIRVFGYTACYPILEAAYRPGEAEPKDVWLCSFQEGHSSGSKTAIA